MEKAPVYHIIDNAGDGGPPSPGIPRRRQAPIVHEGRRDAVHDHSRRSRSKSSSSKRRNTRLFDQAQGASLTPAGQLAFEYAERILNLSAELETRLKELSGLAAGPLLIGASMTIGEYVLPQLIGQFKARFPAVVPTLFVGNSEAVQERVAERTLDLGFIESGSPLATLQSEVCCEDELQVVCAPTHPLAKEPFASPASLTQHAYISREAGSGTRLVVVATFSRSACPRNR